MSKKWFWIGAAIGTGLFFLSKKKASAATITAGGGGSDLPFVTIPTAPGASPSPASAYAAPGALPPGTTPYAPGPVTVTYASQKSLIPAGIPVIFKPTSLPSGSTSSGPVLSGWERLRRIKPY